MKLHSILPACLTVALTLSSAALAQSSDGSGTFRVTIRGEVENNQLSVSPLSVVDSGEMATIEFLLDEGDFVNSSVFPVRGYVIQQDSFSMIFDTVSAGLQDPFPAGLDPLFVVRDNDPAVDGFFLNTNTDGFPSGVPIEYAGGLGQLTSAFSVTYGGDRLPSLDIAHAVGFYDFDVRVRSPHLV